ncbi:MAG: RHS repeat-associated core domain-containing protein, partial [Spartobacteria bacterium]|nr:RHS repeat-associated core domain-containing protein [Spartobacteria bacterium]
RARYYNPLTMRFLNSDPAMDGLNWYAYAGGNPINNSDPSGLDVIVLNNSSAVRNFGHIGALVGSDDSGWNYYSKNGYGQGKWSENDNTNQPFNSFAVPRRDNREESRALDFTIIAGELGRGTVGL